MSGVIPKVTCGQGRMVASISVGQVISWGSIYYAFTLLASPLERDLGWQAGTTFGIFCWGLFVAGIVALPVGVLLDRFGGQPVLGGGSVLSGIGLIMLGDVHSIAWFFVAWSLLGIAMALVLYEAAFATICREFPTDARRLISIVTLVGGLASTIFWPLTWKLETLIGWRDTYRYYGIVHLLLCAPLHFMMPVRRPFVASPARERTIGGKEGFFLWQALLSSEFWKLAFSFSVSAFVFSSFSIHLVTVLQLLGHSVDKIVLLATIIGPMQILGRLAEMTVGHRLSPEAIGQLIFAALPVALVILSFFGASEVALVVFFVLYGLSNGVATIVRGTIPQAVFGSRNYGAIAGALAVPAFMSKAIAPLLISVCTEANPRPEILLGVMSLLTGFSAVLFFSATANFRHQCLKSDDPI